MSQPKQVATTIPPTTIPSQPFLTWKGFTNQWKTARSVMEHLSLLHLLAKARKQKPYQSSEPVIPPVLYIQFMRSVAATYVGWQFEDGMARDLPHLCSNTRDTALMFCCQGFLLGGQDGRLIDPICASEIDLTLAMIAKATEFGNSTVGITHPDQYERVIGEFFGAVHMYYGATKQTLPDAWFDAIVALRKYKLFDGLCAPDNECVVQALVKQLRKVNARQNRTVKDLVIFQDLSSMTLSPELMRVPEDHIRGYASGDPPLLHLVNDHGINVKPMEWT